MSVTKNYLSLVKFSHTIFAMPFAFIGFFLGIRDTDISDQSPNATGILPTMWNKSLYLFREKGWLFLLVLLCMVFARNAAMSFNRYLDRKYDALNPRTAVREIPAGVLSARSVLWFTVLNSILFIVAAYFINSLCFYLSPAALLVVLGYSYTKRFTALCHLVLGLGLSLAPIGAYLAVTGAFDTLPVLFSFAVLFWVSGFDIIYALQDEAFDRHNELYSIPSVLGGRKALRVSELLHLLSAVAVIAAAFKGNFGVLYWAGVAVFVGMLIYQHSIVKPGDLRRVNLAFMTANGIASVVFAVFVIMDMFFRFQV
ncbi:UbiA-like polyprenyltransferase [Niabella drilacis]|uniref:4-hydroxybenzoate polyprenyltransferase n=1 Tax=Niabella drilacis (strain DSM 25811 / CCM 8410 / CCUG 62505 / LMG 26954 / E90) TaxID=1285928 RepID=A0A1G6KXK5_NIADE|nr:UbiA-like polyprenyltransferase [Niabella drilacis]SDC35541.1 4-hydroxybenzoate polyprenyltransferase [Niabella drilacis]